MPTTPRAHIPTAVGIDVAKASLSVCIRHQDGGERALTIRNIDTDINKKLLTPLSGYAGKVVMESTSHYHWASTLMLRESGIDVRIVNPLLSKQYTSGNIRKVKTDPADAAGLARMAASCDQLPPPFSVSRQQLAIRKKLSTIGSMNHQTQALTASLKSLREAQAILGVTDTDAISALAGSIKELKRTINVLEKECVRETAVDTNMSAKRALLESIPGVSPLCATLALNWFSTGDNITARSWVAFAGIDVSSRESGTWKGRCRITKRGNAFLRKRLYSSARGAVMNNEAFKGYYDDLRKNGYVHVESLVIIARKIVRTMFTVLRDESPFDPLKFSYKLKTI